uniref:G-protein coupled receptors family 1 profile domain-containing protein n=1 Tax=Ascaris lumbricoides TaxID=6252 RepID=A0A9J2PR24_ASCLU
MNNTSSSLLSEEFQACIIRWIYTKIFLAQFLFGFSGNMLNLLVLLSRKMRSRTNLLFAAMAFSDLAFLAVQFQTYLYTSGFLSSTLNALFREYNIFLVAIANWFSALSIWFMLAITIERLTVIRRPFQAVQEPVTRGFIVYIILIVVFSFAVTFVHHIAFRKVYVDGRMHIEMIKHPIISIWTLVQALTVVIMPCILMAILNVLLILSLKKHTFPLDMIHGEQLTGRQAIVITKSKTEKKVNFCIISCDHNGHRHFIEFYIVQYAWGYTLYPGTIRQQTGVKFCTFLYVVVIFSKESYQTNQKLLLETPTKIEYAFKRIFIHLLSYSLIVIIVGTSFSTLTCHSSQHDHSPLTSRSTRFHRDISHEPDEDVCNCGNGFVMSTRFSERRHRTEMQAMSRTKSNRVISVAAL